MTEQQADTIIEKLTNVESYLDKYEFLLHGLAIAVIFLCGQFLWRLILLAKNQSRLFVIPFLLLSSQLYAQEPVIEPLGVDYEVIDYYTAQGDCEIYAEMTFDVRVDGVTHLNQNFFIYLEEPNTVPEITYNTILPDSIIVAFLYAHYCVDETTITADRSWWLCFAECLDSDDWTALVITWQVCQKNAADCDCPEPPPDNPDTDGDGDPDDTDPDDDGDGVPDENDPDHPDYDPGDPGSDPDGDGIPNDEDDDDDGDGVPDPEDPDTPTPADPDPDDPDPTDPDPPDPGDPGDPEEPECPTGDCDETPDEPTLPEDPLPPELPGTPGGGGGGGEEEEPDPCDGNDSDGDGCCNSEDAFPNDPNRCEPEPCDGQDYDEDGCCNAEDAFPYDPEKCEPDPCVEDADGDGCCDDKDLYPSDPEKCDECIDVDGDGCCDGQDAYPEDPNRCEEDEDTDGDGCPDEVDPEPEDPAVNCTCELSVEYLWNPLYQRFIYYIGAQDLIYSMQYTSSEITPISASIPIEIPGLGSTSYEIGTYFDGVENYLGEGIKGTVISAMVNFRSFLLLIIYILFIKAVFRIFD